MMRRLQRFVAENWPMRIWGALIIAGWLAYLAQVWSDSWTFTEWRSFLLFAGLSLASCIVAAGLGLILGSILISPIYIFQASQNGAPFEPGDKVCILTGRAKGRIVSVDSRRQGTSVRVELGDTERKSFKDIYGAHELQRVSARELTSSEPAG